MPSDDETERELIVGQIARGRSVRAVAREFERSEADVKSIVKDAVERVYDGEHLRAEWALEDHRLRSLCLKFFDAAMTGDTASAAVYLKASERRASLAGANAPVAHSVHLAHEAEPAETSTQYFARVIAELRGEPPPSEEGEPDNVTNP